MSHFANTLFRVLTVPISSKDLAMTFKWELGSRVDFNDPHTGEPSVGTIHGRRYSEWMPAEGCTVVGSTMYFIRPDGTEYEQEAEESGIIGVAMTYVVE